MNMYLWISLTLIKLSFYFCTYCYIHGDMAVQKSCFGPVNVIAPWIKLLVLLRISEYDKVQLQECSFIQVVIMLFFVLYFPRNGDWKLTLFAAVFLHDDSKH